MGVILYTYKNGVYVNLTNRCSCNCVFCVRSEENSTLEEAQMWHKKEPTLEDVIAAMDEFEFNGYEELVYCGYGEPTCAYDVLIESARYFKTKHTQKIRVNTNGLGRVYNDKDILPELNKVVDAYSVSLNAANSKRYQEVARPMVQNGFSEMLEFALDCKKAGKDVQFSVVSYISDAEITECEKLAKE